MATPCDFFEPVHVAKGREYLNLCSLPFFSSVFQVQCWKSMLILHPKFFLCISSKKSLASLTYFSLCAPYFWMTSSNVFVCSGERRKCPSSHSPLKCTFLVNVQNQNLIMWNWTKFVFFSFSLPLSYPLFFKVLGVLVIYTYILLLMVELFLKSVEQKTWLLMPSVSLVLK